MGLLATRWEAEYEGHKVVVARNELTRGFRLDWDGNEIAHRTWSLVGLGELHASADCSGRAVEVHVTLDMGGWNGTCEITVDGAKIPVTNVK
jgi:hypothetical protein